MAGADDLKWSERKDFTGGVWERSSDREVAENGLLSLTDCYPLPTGGLRAAPKFKELGMSGYTVGAYIIGVWGIEIPPTSLFNIFMLTLEPDTGGAGSHTLRLERIQINDAIFAGTSSATWDTLKSWTTVVGQSASVQMTEYRTDVGTAHAGYRGYINLPTTLLAGTTQGIWVTDGTTATSGTTFAFAVNAPVGIFAFQSRLMTLKSTQSVNQKVIFTEPGAGTLPSTENYLRPRGESAAPLAFITGISPSDLMVLKKGRGLQVIQGDVLAPFIREVTFSHNMCRTFPVVTDRGLIYSAPNDSVYAWTGSDLQDIAPQLEGNPTEPSLPSHSAFGNQATPENGQMGYSDHYLYAGGEYVCDFRTGAWHHNTSLTDSRYFSTARTSGESEYVIASRSSITTATRSILWAKSDQATVERASKYSFTLPIVEHPFNQTVLRELQFLMQCRSTTTVKVTVTYPDPNPGKTGTLSQDFQAQITSSRPETVRVPIGGIKADWCKVKVEVSVPSGEAPMLERMLVGIQDSTRIKGRYS